MPNCVLPSCYQAATESWLGATERYLGGDLSTRIPRLLTLRSATKQSGFFLMSLTDAFPQAPFNGIRRRFVFTQGLLRQLLIVPQAVERNKYETVPIAYVKEYLREKNGRQDMLSTTMGKKDGIQIHGSTPSRRVILRYPGPGGCHVEREILGEAVFKAGNSLAKLTLTLHDES
ncbi:hypothetical protein B0H17DRAFT_1149032 [Mycena rosella]|uniref:Uncharacterized protein n=1 Tax=Mycena rosella TaxID=1033263 RepID=A0AAD7FVJ5_MYCRO|nr:hypothetical protein B0H17DRAFT_1149032 [Mycena rosella]